MTGMFTNQQDYISGLTPKRIVPRYTTSKVKFADIGSAADWEHGN